MSRFRALRVQEFDGHSRAAVEELGWNDLSPGDVRVAVHYSGVNYKDALAATGRGKILRRFPLIPGIDLAGLVEASEHPDFKPGDAVIATGCGLGEQHDGGFSEKAQLPAEWLIPLPASLSLREAMVIGTAGFAAALAIERLEQNGLRPQPDPGPVAVTGASGGVGALAIDLLSRRGYRVSAITGKAEAEAELRALGADEVLLRDQLDLGRRPLERGRWAAAIDSLGGELLAGLLRTTRADGAIASVGLAADSALTTTVMPFILRGVSLLGVRSADCPMAQKRHVWQRLGDTLRPRHLDRISREEVDLDRLTPVFDALLAGRHSGRTLVRLV